MAIVPVTNDSFVKAILAVKAYWAGTGGGDQWIVIVATCPGARSADPVRRATNTPAPSSKMSMFTVTVTVTALGFVTIAVKFSPLTQLESSWNLKCFDRNGAGSTTTVWVTVAVEPALSATFNVTVKFPALT